MEQLEFSLLTLNEAIANKLKSLEAITSAKDLEEINNFLKESQSLKKTLYSLSDVSYEYVEEGGEAFIEGNGDIDYFDVLVQACNYLIGFHSVVDFKKVESAKSQWILDESADFLTDLRQVFGTRIPVLPGSLEGRDEPVSVKRTVNKGK